MKTALELKKELDLETMMKVMQQAQTKRKKAKAYKWSDYFPATKGV